MGPQPLVPCFPITTLTWDGSPVYHYPASSSANAFAVVIATPHPYPIPSPAFAMSIAKTETANYLSELAAGPSQRPDQEFAHLHRRMKWQLFEDKYQALKNVYSLAIDGIQITERGRRKKVRDWMRGYSERIGRLDGTLNQEKGFDGDGCIWVAGLDGDGGYNRDGSRVRDERLITEGAQKEREKARLLQQFRRCEGELERLNGMVCVPTAGWMRQARTDFVEGGWVGKRRNQEEMIWDAEVHDKTGYEKCEILSESDYDAEDSKDIFDGPVSGSEDGWVYTPATDFDSVSDFDYADRGGNCIVEGDRDDNDRQRR